MSKREKLLAKILSGRADANIPFDPTVALLESLGFELRITGSHHIFTKEDYFLNLQPTRERKLKPRQAKQLREVLLQYKDDE
jgi:predicted RNA binding protein YcfA (HicA-like mRNA interferase family)